MLVAEQQYSESRRTRLELHLHSELSGVELSDLGSWSDKLRYESETANSYPGK